MRDSTAFIQIRPTIIPNNLGTNIQSSFLQIVPTTATINPIINVWIEGSDVWVALKYTNVIPSGKVYFILNSDALDSIYRSMGYTTADGFTSAQISNNLPPTPNTVQIPPRILNSVQFNANNLENTLQSRKFFAIQNNYNSQDDLE